MMNDHVDSLLLPILLHEIRDHRDRFSSDMRRLVVFEWIATTMEFTDLG